MNDADAQLIDRVLDAVAAEAPIVAVVGDVILDRWWAGTAERISREAPAPVVRLTDRVDAPGGAANAAVNLAALGATVRVAAAVGDDDAGRRLAALLESAGVDTDALVHLPEYTTQVKTRIAGGGQVLVRVDEGGTLDDAGRLRLARTAVTASGPADAELICDYGAGACTGAVRDALAVREVRPRVTVVDAHDLAGWAVLRPTVVTPNSLEAERLLGIGLGAGTERVRTAEQSRQLLLTASGAAGVVVTLDRDGTVVHDAAGTTRTTTAPASEANASGAGDTFAAALTLALAVGETLPAAARFAQAAADVVVRQPGTSICTAGMLRAVSTAGTRLLDADALVARLAEERAAGRRIVFTNGCFDVLHLGHTAYLKQAKQLGDVLVVAVNDDESVRRLKGAGRPINTATDRADLLAELPAVDYVTVFQSDTPIPLLQRIEPDVYAKGGDYTPEMLQETDVVRGYGGTVRIVDYVSPHSTSRILARSALAEQVADD